MINPDKTSANVVFSQQRLNRVFNPMDNVLKKYMIEHSNSSVSLNPEILKAIEEASSVPKPYLPDKDPRWLKPNGFFDNDKRDKYFEDDNLLLPEHKTTTWEGTVEEDEETSWMDMSRRLGTQYMLFPIKKGNQIEAVDADTYFTHQLNAGMYKNREEMIKKNLLYLGEQFKYAMNKPEFADPQQNYGNGWYVEPEYGE